MKKSATKKDDIADKVKRQCEKREKEKKDLLNGKDPEKVKSKPMRIGR